MTYFLFKAPPLKIPASCWGLLAGLVGTGLLEIDCISPSSMNRLMEKEIIFFFKGKKINKRQVMEVMNIVLF